MKKRLWLPAYAFTAALGLGLAYVVSSSLMTPAQSQEAPSDGTLPAEFLKEIEGGGTPPPAPPSGGAAKKEGTLPPPPPPSTPPPSAAPVPSPPPQAEAPSSGTAVPPAEESAAPMETATPPAASSVPGSTAFTPNSIDGYVYDGTGRRDPFKPYRIIRPDPQTKGKTDEPLIEPLQRVETEALSVMAILWDVRQPRAVVRDPEGRLHTLVRNTKVGRNNGYVAAIREGEIVVIETYEDEGRQVKQTKILELKN